MERQVANCPVCGWGGGFHDPEAHKAVRGWIPKNKRFTGPSSLFVEWLKSEEKA